MFLNGGNGFMPAGGESNGGPSESARQSSGVGSQRRGKGLKFKVRSDNHVLNCEGNKTKPLIFLFVQAMQFETDFLSYWLIMLFSAIFPIVLWPNDLIFVS
jgi:hypothetical protein